VIKLNSVALVRKRTIPTDPPPLVGEVSAKLLRIKGVPRSARQIPTAVISVWWIVISPKTEWYVVLFSHACPYGLDSLMSIGFPASSSCLRFSCHPVRFCSKCWPHPFSVLYIPCLVRVQRPQTKPRPMKNAVAVEVRRRWLYNGRICRMRILCLGTGRGSALAAVTMQNTAFRNGNLSHQTFIMHFHFLVQQ
jgi:hypothetical protein